MAAEPNTSTTWPTVAQAAERLGVTASRVRQLVLAGTLETERIGPLHVVKPASLSDYERRRESLSKDTMGRVIDAKRGRPRKEAAVAR